MVCAARDARQGRGRVSPTGELASWIGRVGVLVTHLRDT